MREAILQTPRSVGQEGEEVLPEQRFPGACGTEQGEAAVPLQPMELHGGAEIHLQPTGNPRLEQGMPKGGCDPMEGTHTGAVWEELQPRGRTPVEEFCGRLSLVGGIHAGAGEEFGKFVP